MLVTFLTLLTIGCTIGGIFMMYSGINHLCKDIGLPVLVGYDIIQLFCGLGFLGCAAYAYFILRRVLREW